MGAAHEALGLIGLAGGIWLQSLGSREVSETRVCQCQCVCSSEDTVQAARLGPWFLFVVIAGLPLCQPWIGLPDHHSAKRGWGSGGDRCCQGQAQQMPVRSSKRAANPGAIRPSRTMNFQEGELAYVRYLGDLGVVHTRLLLGHIEGDAWMIRTPDRDIGMCIWRSSIPAMETLLTSGIAPTAECRGEFQPTSLRLCLQQNILAYCKRRADEVAAERTRRGLDGVRPAAPAGPAAVVLRGLRLQWLSWRLPLRLVKQCTIQIHCVGWPRGP